MRFVTERIKEMANGGFTVEASNFFIEEDTDFSTCLRCDEMIIGKSYQAVTMFKCDLSIRFQEHNGLKICEECYEDVKHRFEP